MDNRKLSKEEFLKAMEAAVRRKQGEEVPEVRIPGRPLPVPDGRLVINPQVAPNPVDPEADATRLMIMRMQQQKAADPESVVKEAEIQAAEQPEDEKMMQIRKNILMQKAKKRPAFE